MAKIILCIIIVSSIISKELCSQHNDSTIILDEFTKSTRLNSIQSFTKVINHELNKDEINNSTLDEFLNSNSAIFIKSYGPGYLSSISLRGGNAQQTSVVWNGFVINSPLNGITDLSIIPNSFIDEINIHYGNTASLWGNGGVSGAIHLTNKYKFKESINIKIGSSIGSFSNFKNYINISKGFEKWHTSFRFFRNQNENDFAIINPTSKQRFSQSNSNIYQLSLMNENYFHLGSNSQLKIIGMYQQLYRQIPPTLSENQSLANQDDYVTRILTEYKFFRRNYSLNIRSSYLNEINNYFNPISSIESNNPCTSFINEIDFKNNINKNHVISLSIMNNYSFSNGNNYSSKIKQNRLSATLLYNWKSKDNKWSQSFNTRQVYNNNQLVPLTFSYGANWFASEKLSFYGNIGKLYRLPTINDLYWNPGGNTELQPEDGYSNDIGAIINIDLEKNLKFNFETTIFNRKINNWIIWYPSGSFWSPQNILKVWSRGIETNSTITYHLNSIKFDLRFNTSYVVSTNQETINDNDQSLGKQLIYTPYYVLNTILKIRFKKIDLSYNHTYNGYRFTTADNTQFVDPFHLTNIKLSYTDKFKNYPLKIFYKLNNVFNVNYQVVLNRPMPLINHEIGFNFNINK